MRGRGRTGRRDNRRNKAPILCSISTIHYNMSKFSDTASIYSTTETLVDLPVLTDSNEDAATVVSSSHSLEDAHLVLYSSWTRSDRREDDILGERLTRGE